MKKLITEYQSIYGMAFINPRMCKNSKIPIRIEVEEGGEGPIPHMHVFFDSYRNPERLSYIRLDEPGYLPNHKSYRPTKKEFNSMIHVLKSEWPRRTIFSRNSDEEIIATGYQAAVDVWIESNGDKYIDQFQFDEDGFPIMPNYSYDKF